MSAPVRDPDDGRSKDEPLSYAPNRARHPKFDQNPAGATQKVDSTPQHGSPEPPPWRRSKRSDAFADDVVIAELRNRPALAPDRLPAPPPVSTGSKFPLAVRFAAVVAVAAAGVIGYRLGLAPPASPQQINRSNQEDVASERSVSTGNLDNPSHGSGPAFQAPPGSVSTEVAVDNGRGASDRTTSGDAPPPAFASAPNFTEQKPRDLPSPQASFRQLAVNAVKTRQVGEPARLTMSAGDAGANGAVVIDGLAPGSALSVGTQAGPRTWRLSTQGLNETTIMPPSGFVGTMDLTLELRLTDNTVADRKSLRLEWSPKSALGPAESQLQRLAAGEIELMLKRGAEYMATGNIGAARMILQPAAEAGDAKAAFALAEAYDPLVLRKLNVKGGIAADISLAQTWYDKAKDLGSAVASERLARLARLPE
jgi:TPR repeat protein